MKSIFEKYVFKASGIILKNRIALAPMTNGQSNADGSLGKDELRWLTRRAKEGFGMIITCAAHVSEDGQGWPGELGIFSEKHIEGLTRLATALKAFGSVNVVQLFHGGARSPESLIGKTPWSASAINKSESGKELMVREATTAEIEQVIQAFYNAAQRAYTAGFNGVELHGAHGYLLHQFISTATNHRTDQWGGSFENRTRLVRTILSKIKQGLPPHFMVGIRLSPEDKFTFKGIDFDESVLLASTLADEGADFIHISPWNAFKKPDKYPDKDKALITYFREDVKPEVPIIVAGEIWSAKEADQAMKLGADIVALGRAAIGIPDWPVKALDPEFIPQLPPYTESWLKQADLGPDFIKYMKRWNGFVKE